MTKYIVKETSVATPENPSFAGETSIYWHGKGNQVIGIEGDHARHPTTPSKYFICEYGYDRLCDAKRNWSYKNPENSKYWRSTAEIVEVKVC